MLLGKINVSIPVLHVTHTSCVTSKRTKRYKHVKHNERLRVTYTARVTNV